MVHFKLSALAFGVCLFFAAGAYGQRQKPVAERPDNKTSTVSAPVVSSPIEPDSPASDSNVTASPQATSQAIVPRLIKFSGALRDVTGKPLSGPLDVTFALYDTETGGNPLWFETQSVQADELGHYTALLGAMHTEVLPIELFTSGEVRWLGIQVGHEQEQQPRVLLVSVPYALKAGDAETLGGKPPSAYMLSDSQSAGISGSASTSNAGTVPGSGTEKQPAKNSAGPLVTACGSVTSNNGGMANSIAMFTTACNVESSNIFQSNGNVGIGTTNPLGALDIHGNQVILFNGNTAMSRNGNTGALTISTNASDIILSPASGNVGIGTTAPAARLQIQSPAGQAFAPVLAIREGGSPTYGFTFLQDDLTTGDMEIDRLVAGASSQVMTLQRNTGNVGIGTPSPVATLDVAGNFNIPQTTGGGATGVIGLGGSPFIHACCGNNSNIFVGLSSGNFTTGATNNTAIGNQSLRSIGTGSGNTAIGSQALDMDQGGVQNTATGDAALDSNVGGSFNTAAGVQALQDNTTGSYNSGIGDYAGNTTNFMFTTGSYNTFVGANSSSGTQTNLTNATALGANSVVGESNALVLGSINGLNGATSNVNVGIGTSTPSAPLDVEYPGTTASSTAIVGNATATTGCYTYGVLGESANAKGIGIYGYVSSTANTAYGVYGFAGSPAYAGYFQGNAYVGGNLTVTGSVTAASYVTSSSRRIKTNILALEGAMAKVQKLQGVSYDLKSNGEHQIGLIAEDVGKVVPEVVSYEENGVDAKGVDYSRLTALLIEATKEQQALIRKQKAEGQSQRAQIRRLTQQVQQLQKSQHAIAALEARLARLEAGNKSEQTIAAAPHVKKQRSGTLVAKVQF